MRWVRAAPPPAWQMPPTERRRSVVLGMVAAGAVVRAAAARALDVHGDTAPARTAHGGLDAVHAGAQRAEAGDALEGRAARDLHADRPALGVVQPERAVV